jgi:hypothetical protein
LKYREVHYAESTVSIHEIVEIIETNFVLKDGFVLVRANDDFHVIVQHRALWFNFAECVEFVLNVFSDSRFNHA